MKHFKRPTLLAAALLATSFSSYVEAAPPKPMPFSDAEAIHAIIGEAEDQGWAGMLAIAHAIRNRGSLEGVRGLHRDISHAPLSVKADAATAWMVSAKGADTTGGATAWENVSRFGEPAWAKTMTRTIIIKDHWFYKEKHK